MPDRLSFIFRELLDVHKPRSGDRMPAHGASHGFAISGRTSPNGAMGRKTLSTIPRHSIMPAAKKSAPNEALYDKLIATIPEIERKGDANPYTSLNGNMFTLLHQSRLAIRLPENERDEFLKKVPDELIRSLRHSHEGIRRRPRRPLTQDEVTEEVSRAKLFLCQDLKTETDEKDEVVFPS